MESKNLNLKNIFRIISKHMEEEFSVVLDKVSHPLEKGIAREKVLVTFLKRFLPKRFGIDTGFVIDSTGNCSKQVDIIIYDKIISPVFTLPGDLRYFPAECVVAVGEVKTTINSKKTLTDALGKISSVKKLNKFGDKKVFDGGLHASHGHINQNIGSNENLPECYQTFGFVFSSKSLNRDNLILHSALEREQK